MKTPRELLFREHPAHRRVGDQEFGLEFVQLSDRLLDSLVPLRNVRAENLDPVLNAEVEAWRPLHWDFRPSADLVRRFCAMQALEGFVLIVGGEAVGFCYSVAEEGKGPATDSPTPHDE